MIKEAYKGSGLRIGSTDEGLYLSGGYWVIWIKRDQIPKEKLAAIIELVGEIPEQGVAYRATKDGQQYELEWNEFYETMENAKKCDRELEVTRMIIEGKQDADSRVLQDPDTGKIRLINEAFIRMLDNSKVESKKGHTEAVGPVCSRMPGAFWYNNIMALHVMERTDDASMRLIEFLEGIDINGESREKSGEN